VIIKPLKKIRRVLNQEGAWPLYRKIKRRLSHRGTIAYLRDRIVLQFAIDPYTLPMRYRYEDIYFNSRASGDEKYELICSHTKCHYLDDEDVLDLGCGPGQVAAAFARRNPDLGYVGIEPQVEKIRALKKQYKRTAFEFHHVDLANDFYNPGGTVDPEKTTLEIIQCNFDLIILSSVFTHVRPGTVENYSRLLSRLLKSDGRVWATCYLITEDEDRWLKDDRDFAIEHDGFYSPYETKPERSIAYPKEYLLDMLELGGLEVENCVYGSWRGGKYDFDRNRFYQDILILSAS
jgi:SAM-dependent methyltransferase